MRRVSPGMGFWSFETACLTIQGYEAMHQLRKGQIQGTAKRDVRSQVRFLHTAFGLAAQHKPCLSPLFHHALVRSPQTCCNTTSLSILKYGKIDMVCTQLSAL